eukprot:scaffold14622_cov132-Isochrysis_galbana.AAC.5
MLSADRATPVSRELLTSEMRMHSDYDHNTANPADTRSRAWGADRWPWRSTARLLSAVPFLAGRVLVDAHTPTRVVGTHLSIGVSAAWATTVRWDSG